LDLADELRLHPHDVALAHLRHLRHGLERRRLALERAQLLQQLLDLLAGEAGADVADVVELLPATDRQDERAKRAGSPALPLRVAGDDELLAAVRLDLQPVARTAADRVPRVGALGHDPFEPLLLRRLEQRLAVVEHLGEADCAVAPVEQLLEPPAALGQRQVDQRLALELEQVEDEVDERCPGLALLHRREARPALLVERANLAVEHAVRRLQRFRDLLCHLREALRQVVALSAGERRLCLGHAREGAEAVPLDLEQPAGPLRRLLLERRQHRRVVTGRPRLLRGFLALLEQQPVLGIAVELCRHERPSAVEPLAAQADGEAAVLLLLDELVGALVPDLDRTGAVLPLRDLALEAGIVERVVLDVDGERPLPRLERHALRHGPARERAVALEAEVVVKPPCVVTLDDEDRLLALFLGLAKRLRGLLRVALAPIFSQLLARHRADATGRSAGDRIYSPRTRQISLATAIHSRKQLVSTLNGLCQNRG